MQLSTLLLVLFSASAQSQYKSEYEGLLETWNTTVEGPPHNQEIENFTKLRAELCNQFNRDDSADVVYVSAESNLNAQDLLILRKLVVANDPLEALNNFKESVETENVLEKEVTIPYFGEPKESNLVEFKSKTKAVKEALAYTLYGGISLFKVPDMGRYYVVSAFKFDHSEDYQKIKIAGNFNLFPLYDKQIELEAETLAKTEFPATGLAKFEVLIKPKKDHVALLIRCVRLVDSTNSVRQGITNFLQGLMDNQVWDRKFSQQELKYVQNYTTLRNLLQSIIPIRGGLAVAARDLTGEIAKNVENTDKFSHNVCLYFRLKSDHT